MSTGESPSDLNTQLLGEPVIPAAPCVGKDLLLRA
jgi:hypothetical protein